MTRNEEKYIRDHRIVKSEKISLNMLQTKKEGVLFQDGELASMAEEYTEVTTR